MKIIKKLFAAKEVKGLLDTLDEVNAKYNNTAAKQVHDLIEARILKYSHEYIEEVKKGKSARQVIYSDIAHISGDMVESGQFHLYRGVLNPHGTGQGLLKLFDNAVEELKDIGAMDPGMVEVQKRALREKIQKVG